MKTSKMLIFSACLVLAAGLAVPIDAGAATIPLNTAFSNYDPGDSGYTGDYGTVYLIELQGGIQFTVIPGAGLGENPDLQWFYFNTRDSIVDPIISFGPGTLNYAYNTTDKFYKPDGDGYFDGVVDFGNGGDPKLNRVTFILTADGDLSVSDFIVGSVGGNKGAFTVAAHWQNTTTRASSEFVGGNVPIPGAVWLLGSGLMAFLGFGRKISRE